MQDLYSLCGRDNNIIPRLNKEREYIIMSNIYNTKFVSAVRSVLVMACADGKAISRETVCEALSLEGIEVSPDTLKVAMAEGAFNSSKQAWALFAGRFGGIRELDLAETNRLNAEQEARRASIQARISKRLATLAARKAAPVATPAVEVQAPV